MAIECSSQVLNQSRKSMQNPGCKNGPTVTAINYGDVSKLGIMMPSQKMYKHVRFESECSFMFIYPSEFISIPLWFNSSPLPSWHAMPIVPDTMKRAPQEIDPDEAERAPIWVLSYLFQHSSNTNNIKKLVAIPNFPSPPLQVSEISFLLIATT